MRSQPPSSPAIFQHPLRRVPKISSLQNPSIDWDALIQWYHTHHRQLPWRIVKQNHPSPYAVWVAEVMLQQTTVVTVRHYFERFMQRFPTIASLARASLDDVLHAWQGLGYYRRAKHLHAAAQTIITHHQGCMPEDSGARRTLPGIGAYMNAAIGAIAFNQRAWPMDGNMIRVMARLLATQPPTSRLQWVNTPPLIFPHHHHASDVVQAMFDLGATICTPKNPQCASCPLQQSCRAYCTHQTHLIPAPITKAQTPQLFGDVYIVIDQSSQHVWLRQRPSHGLLANMWEFPSTPWQPQQTDSPPLSSPLLPPIKSTDDVCIDSKRLKHVFTHQTWHGRLIVVQQTQRHNLAEGEWIGIDRLKDYALSTWSHKVWARAQQIIQHASAYRVWHSGQSSASMQTPIPTKQLKPATATARRVAKRSTTIAKRKH